MAPKYLQSALGALLILSSATFTDARSYPVKRAPLAVPNTLPGSWTSLGCYTEIGRTLPDGGYDDNLKMTDESCINYCTIKGYLYAGTENSKQCFCGSKIATGAAKAAAADCSSPCTGNSTQPCGGLNRLNMFWSNTTGPQTNPGNDSWVFSGCYTENINARTLPVSVNTTGGSANMTVDLCTTACRKQGYKLAGAEYGGQCWCGNAIANGGVLAPEGLAGCNTLCNGNLSEYCGGNGRLDVYNFNRTVNLPPYTTISSTTSSISKTSSTSKSTSSSSSSSSKFTTTTSKSSTSSKSSSSTSSSSKSSTTTRPSSTTSSSRSSTSSKPTTTSTSKSSTSSSTSKSSTSSKPTSSSTSTSKTSTSTSTSTSKSSSSSSSTSKSSSSASKTTSSSTTLTSSTSSSKSSSSISKTTSSSTLSSTSTSSSKSLTSTSSSKSSSSSSTSSKPSTSSTSSQSSSTSSKPSSSSSTTAKSSTSSSTTKVSSTTSSSTTSKISSSSSSSLSSSSSSSKPTTTTTSSSTSKLSSSSSSSLMTSSSTSKSSSTSQSSTSKPTSTTTSTSSSTSQSSASKSTSASTSTTSSTSSTSSSSTSMTSSSAAASSTSASTSSDSSSSSVTTSSTDTTSMTWSSSSSTITSFSSTTSMISSSSSSSTTSSVKPVKTAPSIDAFIGEYAYIGCYKETQNGRALQGATYADDTMTLELCKADCAGFTYFGVEYGRECYCGNTVAQLSTRAPTSDCSFFCPGDQYEYCGAGDRLSMYQLNSTVTNDPSATTTTATDGSAATSAAPVPSTFPANWTSQGCWVDGVNGRILNNQLPDSTTLTLESCVNSCASLGYTIAGAEYEVQCFCDNYVYNGGALATNQGDCNAPCRGNSSESCGGGGRLSMYSLGTPKVYKAPGPKTTDLPENWTYSGCLEDNIASVEDPNEILNTFPYKFESENNMTVENCINKCQEYGYDAAGLEYGIQCFCGDVANIQIASAPSPGGGYTRSRVPQVFADSQCNVPCSGDGEYYCGAGNRLSWYSYNGTDPLYSWDFPTGSAAGKYDLLIGGVTVPLITSQVITGKVTFVEKAGTGAPNGTGAYELDLTQIDNFDAAWRTMNGFQTDVFCSAGLTLPDRKGRQLTVGGWAGASNYGIRLYLPDGSDGVKGKNQWVEDPQNLQLQVPRWYPSALVMANGSVVVIGGEIGQNDLAQPTLELLPPTGVKTTTTKSGYSNTTVYLDFLARTHPFNLYPFVTVVNSGIFIAYYNEARILDDKTFETIKVLPTIPGAVHRSDGGRSYQLEGTMMTLPQYAPFTDPLGVLICGGSTPAGGEALDNCVSTYPEAAEPTWTIERMPSRRVLPCMAALPDGTYLILNGAEHGVAGFGLAYDPNFNALLYDPSKPLHSRISVMANTTVARLYHSEAIVLLDGRVMVSGSDPQNDPNAPYFYPEEYRVEAFSPPYLLSGDPRPVLSITNKDWAYGESIDFTTTGGTGAIRVSLLGSVVSTHGNSMGQRTLFPAVSCSGNSCTVTAPPTAHACPPGWYQMFVLSGPTPSVGVFVRIGGDPAGLGDWPNLPSFELPGDGPV